MQGKTFLLKSHPDFHIPADVVVGEGFDGEAYCRRVRESGADAVAIFGKCHYGHSYYYTKVGHRHPLLRKDMLGEVCRSAKKVGLGVVGYYSVFLDSVAVAKHPDWRLQAQDAKTDAGFDSGNFQPLCVNSPYLEELLIPQTIEMVSNYEFDELLFDTMTGFQPCFCEACKRKFGREVPTGNTHANWGDYVKWYARCYEDFYARTADAVHGANPRVAALFNWEWVYARPRPAVKHIRRLCADLISTGTVASTHCRYFAGTGMSFDYMTGRFMHGLGDWNSNTPESLLYTGAATLANGGSFYIIDRQLPDGSMEDRAFDMMRKVFGYFQERRQWLEGTAHVPEIAAIYSWNSAMGENLEFYPDANARKQRIAPYEGLTRLMIEHGRHFTAMSEERLNEQLAEYRAVIVPEQQFLTEQTRRNLAVFVERGGSLIISQAAWDNSPDAALPELAGIKWEGKRDLEYGYVDTAPPLMLRERFGRILPLPGTEVLHRYVPPMCAGQGGKKFGHGYAPPTAPSDEPVITMRKVGKGCVIYIAHPFLKAYADYQNPDQARLFLNVLDLVLPDPIARVDTRSQVELCVMRKGEDLVVHLVNHSGRERLGGHWYPVTEYIPEIRDIPLLIRGEGLIATLVPENRPLGREERDGYCRFVVPSLEVMATVSVPGYFR